MILLGLDDFVSKQISLGNVLIKKTIKTNVIIEEKVS